jgi:hypothetical protein
MEWLAFGLSAICAIGSFISFILAQKEKNEAKKSETAAKEYAENANKANIEIQKFTQHLNAEVDKQLTFETEKEKVKQYLIGYYNNGKHPVSRISQVFLELYQNKGDKALLANILRELESDGMIKQTIIDGIGEYEIFAILRDY